MGCTRLYRDEIYSLQILLNTTQAGPGRTVKQEQEEISPNHVQRINLISVHRLEMQVFFITAYKVWKLSQPYFKIEPGKNESNKAQ